MDLDLRTLQPKLPTFEWEDEGFPHKKYTATKKILYTSTRKHFDKLLYDQDVALAENDTKKVKKLEKDIINYLDILFPGTKKDKLFDGDNSPLPTYAKNGLYLYVMSLIRNVVFIPPGNKFSHDEAEAMLALTVKEKAAREMTTNENVYEGLQREIKKK